MKGVYFELSGNQVMVKVSERRFRWDFIKEA